MTNTEFAGRVRRTADLPTAYMLGTYGWRTTDDLIDRALRQYPKNEKYAPAARTVDGFMFDCCGLIKAVLWGFTGDKNAPYGGAEYAKSPVPDVNEEGLKDYCSVSADIGAAQTGDLLFTDGHCGVYVGGGLAVECTPAFGGGVVVTAIKDGLGRPVRQWKWRGRLKFIDYEEDKTVTVLLKELKNGAKGESVRAMQRLLIAGGFSCGITGADGDFGAMTEKAVRKYQTARGLDADGICGVNTWSALLGAER